MRSAALALAVLAFLATTACSELGSYDPATTGSTFTTMPTYAAETAAYATDRTYLTAGSGYFVGGGYFCCFGHHHRHRAAHHHHR